MVQWHEYHRLGEGSGPYPYNLLAPGAPIDFVQLSTIYQVVTGEITYHGFDEEIQRVARLPPTDKRYVNLFPFENSGFLFDAWRPQSTSCPPSKVVMIDTGTTGPDLFPFDTTYTSMNRRSSRQGILERVIHFIRTSSSKLSYRKISMCIDTIMTFQCRGSSRRSSLTSKQHIKATYAVGI